MSKQDRQGVRTAADVERKYNYTKRFAEVLGIAEEARSTAEQAQNNYDNLTAEEIFAILTNDGEEQGIYRQNGKVYINARYILAGSFTATGEVFFEPGLEEFETIKAHILGSATIPDDQIPLYDFNNDGDVSITDLIICKAAMLGQSSLAEWSGAELSEATVTMDATNVSKTIKISGTNMWGRAVEHYMGFDGVNLGTHHGDFLVSGKLSVGGGVTFEDDTLALGNDAPKKLSWKDNGDGTYSLIGEG